eukprot:gene34082-56794_t
MRFKYTDDFVQAIEVCDPTARLLVAREDGIGKRTPFDAYRLTRRGGTGIIAIELPEDASVNVAGALRVSDSDEVMLLTAKGQSVRCPVNTIRETGRGAKGVKLLTLAPGDKLLSIARVVESAEEQEAAGTEATDTLPKEQNLSPRRASPTSPTAVSRPEGEIACLQQMNRLTLALGTEESLRFRQGFQP